MATYLVIHSPREEPSEATEQPTDLIGLARSAAATDRGPRWLRTWSPDVHDDRIFTLWEAASAAEIQQQLVRFGFLTNMDSLALRVRAWGPDDVLAVAADADTDAAAERY